MDICVYIHVYIYRPSSKGTKRLFQVIKAIIIDSYTQRTTTSTIVHDFETDARNKMGYFDGSAQRTFGRWMRARYGQISDAHKLHPRCGQPL